VKTCKRKSDNEECAVKLIHFPFEEVDDYAVNARNEYAILQQFVNHKSFVKVYDYFESSTEAKLVMEKLNGFTIQEYIE
jgi:serine/threonine protein kinase